MSDTQTGQSSKYAQSRVPMPVGIVEIILLGLLLYVVYQLFLADDPRTSRANGEMSVATRVR